MVDLTDQFVEVKLVRSGDSVVLTVSFFETVAVFLKMLKDLPLKDKKKRFTISSMKTISSYMI